MSDALRQLSFLVTCPGAYDDSGSGTGGLVCVHRGEAFVADRLDSTGLCRTGGRIYRWVRPLQGIAGYDEHGLQYFLRLPGTKDVHGLRTTDDGFVCVSTGTNEIVWFDPLGNRLKSWRAGGKGDAWHLNGIEEVEGELYASAFGEFRGHREWEGQVHRNGFVFQVRTGHRVAARLSGPHDPCRAGGCWFVCDSFARGLAVFSPDGNLRTVPLAGFTRGLAFTAEHILVGESAQRHDERAADHSFVAVLNRQTLEVAGRIRIPFPEIYGIVIVSEEWAAALAAAPGKFELLDTGRRTIFLEEQLDRLRQELAIRKRPLISPGSWRRMVRRFFP